MNNGAGSSADAICQAKVSSHMWFNFPPKNSAESAENSLLSIAIAFILCYNTDTAITGLISL